MKNTDEQAIHDGMARALAEGGFRKKGMTWYLDKPEVILVANLQRSNFGAQHYVNLAVCLKDPATKNAHLREEQCHIRERLTSPELDRALDAEDLSLTPAQREAALYEAVQRGALPFLNGLDSVSKIIESYRRGLLADALVHKLVKELANREAQAA